MIVDKLGGGHYETMDEWPVVILCLDAPGPRPVVGYVVLADGTSFPHGWRADGTCGDSSNKTEMDLRPVKRKPREVWLYAGAVFEEGMVDKEDFLASVKHSNQPGYIRFREVKEEEDQ